MAKRFFCIALFMIVLIVPGCGTMMLMLGDNIRYAISGKVQRISGNKIENGINNVVVEIECKGIEKSIYQNKATITDVNGYYKMTGYWSLDGCIMRLTHNDYNTKVLIIDNTNLTRTTGLSLTYEANVILESQSSK